MPKHGVASTTLEIRVHVRRARRLVLRGEYHAFQVQNDRSDLAASVRPDPPSPRLSVWAWAHGDKLVA